MAKALDPDTSYYLERSASGYVGNCMLWWKRGHHGYTCDLDDAHVFQGGDPRFLSAMASGKYRAWPVAHIDEAATRHADMQRVDLASAISAPAPAAGQEPDHA